MRDFLADTFGFEDFEIDTEPDAPDFLLADLPTGRSTYRPTGWWTTTANEAEHLDYPSFESATDRARFTITAMACTTLARTGGTADDAVFPVDGKLSSLNEMLDEIDAMEHERLKVWMDRPR